MEFSLPPNVIKIQKKAAKIINDVYMPEENQLLDNYLINFSNANDIANIVKTNAINENLWAVETLQEGKKSYGILGRMAIEESIGGTILPSMDFGGNGDLLAWIMWSNKNCLKCIIDPVIREKKNYEVFYLECNLNESFSNSNISATEENGRFIINGERSIVSCISQNDCVVIFALAKVDNKNMPFFFSIKDNQITNGMTIKDLKTGFSKKNY